VSIQADLLIFSFAGQEQGRVPKPLRYLYQNVMNKKPSCR